MQFEQLETDYMKCLDEVLCKLEELLKSHFELSEGLMTSYYEGDNHRQRYLNLNNSGVESSLKEVRALIEEIYGKHIQYHYHYEFIETLSDEFTRISKWNVRLDDLKKEMLSHLNLVVEKFFAFSKHIDFEETALSLEKKLHNLFQPELYHVCRERIQKFRYATFECQDAYYKTIICLRRLIEYFLTPTECPPKM